MVRKWYEKLEKPSPRKQNFCNLLRNFLFKKKKKTNVTNKIRISFEISVCLEISCKTESGALQIENEGRTCGNGTCQLP